MAVHKRPSDAGPATVASPFIQVCTASADSVVRTNLVSSLLKLGQFCDQQRIGCRVSCAYGDDLALQLDEIVTDALNDRSVTHILLIDPDLGFEPDAVSALLEANVPLACMAVPTKCFTLRHLFREATRTGYMQERSQSSTANPDIDEGEHVRLGFALFRRDALEQILKAKGAAVYSREEPFEDDSIFRPPPKKLYGFFAPIYIEENATQVYLQDALQYRWQKFGKGRISVIDGYDLQSLGTLRHSARFADFESF